MEKTVNTKIPREELKKSKSPVQFKGSEFYQQVDEEGKPIGDVKCVDVVVKEIPRSGFAITYIGEIIRMIDSIGNKKMQVVKFLLSNMDSNNKLSLTIDEIVSASGVSRPVVVKTLQILENAGIIARKVGTVMLSPKLVHKGNVQKERYLMTKFNSISN